MALTKTTSIDVVDAWQAVVAGTLVEGAVENVSANYSSMLYIECAIIEAVDHSGVEIIVEVSYADDNWVKLIEFKGTAEQPATTQIADNPLAQGSTTVNLDNAGAGDFDVVGRKWFIKDPDGVGIEDSESVRTKSEAGNAVVLCQDTLRAHAVNKDCYDRVDEWVIKIPFAVSQVRVLVNNVDADSDVAFTTRISKITALS